MSLFTEYEKLRTARKSLLIGSKWKNGVNDTVYITRVSQENVFYSYNNSYNCNIYYYRDIEYFKRNFKPVL